MRKNNKKKVDIKIGKLIYLRDVNEYGGAGIIVDYFPKGYFANYEIIEVRCSKIDEAVYLPITTWFRVKDHGKTWKYPEDGYFVDSNVK